MDFCRKVIHRHHMTPHNFGGIFTELFKIVVVQIEAYKILKKLLKEFSRAKFYYENNFYCY